MYNPAPCQWIVPAEIISLKHLADAENIPQHDPAIHGKPIRNGIVSFFMCIPGTLMMILVLYPFLALLALIPRRR